MEEKEGGREGIRKGRSEGEKEKREREEEEGGKEEETGKLKEGRVNEGGKTQKMIMMIILTMIIMNNLVVFPSSFSIVGLTIIGSSGHIVNSETYNQCWVQR